MLSLQTFRAANDKVFKVEFHPTQPWLLAATKTDFISVWDWTNQEVIHKLQLGGVSEDELFAPSDLARFHAKDSTVTVNPSLSGPSTSRSVTGKVRDVRFLDADVVAQQLAHNHALVEGPAVPPPSAAPVAAAMQGQRLLVVVCESKVLVIDLLGSTTRELPKQAFDGKQPTCCAFLLLSGQPSWPAQVMPSPVLAIGCSDGQVRLFHAATLHPIAFLSSPHKSADTCLTVSHAKGHPYEVLTAGFQGGSLTSWEPYAKPMGAGRGLAITPRADLKAHEREVTGLVTAMVDESPEQPTTVLVTAGADGKLMAYEQPLLHEVYKHKMADKTPVWCLAYTPRGYTASNTHCLLVGTELGLVLAVQPGTGSVRLVANLNGQVPHGGKKQPKVYAIAVHPLQPQHVALATNAGVALMQVEALYTPPAAAVPLQSPGQVLDGKGDGVTFVTSIGDSVYCLTATARGEGRTAVLPLKAPEKKPAPHEPEKSEKDQDKKGDKDKKSDKDKKGKGKDKDAKQEAKQAEKPAERAPSESGKGKPPLPATSKPPTPPPAPTPPPRPAEDNLLDLLDDIPPPSQGARSVASVPAALAAAVAAAAGEREGPTGDPYAKPTSVMVMQASKLCTGRPATRALLSASCDGLYVSVTWPLSKQYSVYMRLETDKGLVWEEICSGAGVSVAWHGCEPRFAVVEPVVPPPMAPVAPPAKQSRFKSSKAAAKEAERQRQEAAALAAAQAAANTPPTVLVRLCDGPTTRVVHAKLPMSPQDAALSVVGGPLLGVALKRQLNNAADLNPGGEAPCALQLYDWASAQRVGVELPQPLLMSWDPSMSLVAMAYTSQVLLCTTQPSLQPVASLPISNATGIEWGMRQLYICTHTHIYAAFVTLPPADEPHAPPIRVHLQLFACFGAPLYQPAPLANLGGSPLALPRPGGPLALLGPRDGFLWVVNTHAQALALPLAKHAGMRVMCLAAAGDYQAAVEAANSSLPPDQHALVSELLCSMHGTNGTRAALMLRGLRLADEAQLRIRLHQWPQAFEAVEAMLAGFTARPGPNSGFTCPVAHAAFNVEGGSSFSAAGPMDFASYAPVMPAAAQQYAEDLDWLGPLRSAASSASTHTALLAARASRPAALSLTSTQALDVALALLSEFKQLNMQDVARHLITLISSYAPSLSASQLASLVTIMSELGMRQELPAIVNGIAFGAEGGLREVVGLVAALCTGHATLVRDVLSAGSGGAGNAALAAAHAAAYLSKQDGGMMGSLHDTGRAFRAARDDSLKQQALAHAAPGAQPDQVPYLKLVYDGADE